MGRRATTSRDIEHLLWEVAYAGGSFEEALRAFEGALGVDGALVVCRLEGNAVEEVHAVSGLLAPSIDRWARRYRFIDPHTRPAMRTRPLVAFRGRDLVSDRALRATEFHADYMEPNGIGADFVGIHVASPDGRSVALAVHHAADRGPYDDATVRAIERLFPTLARAVDVHTRLCDRDRRARDLEATLGLVAQPIVWVDGARPPRVGFANAAAVRALDAALGVWLDGGVLAVVDPSARSELEDAIACLLGGRSVGGSLSLPGPAGATRVALRPLPHATPTGRAVACFLEPRRREAAWAAPLSARQREVAELLAAGATLREVGTCLGVGVETLKSHQKAIYERLGIGSRAELARLVAAGDAVASDGR